MQRSVYDQVLDELGLQGSQVGHKTRGCKCLNFLEKKIWSYGKEVGSLEGQIGVLGAFKQFVGRQCV